MLAIGAPAWQGCAVDDWTSRGEYSASVRLLSAQSSRRIQACQCTRTHLLFVSEVRPRQGHSAVHVFVAPMVSRLLQGCCCTHKRTKMECVPGMSLAQPLSGICTRPRSTLRRWLALGQVSMKRRPAQAGLGLRSQPPLATLPVPRTSLLHRSQHTPPRLGALHRLHVAHWLDMCEVLHYRDESGLRRTVAKSLATGPTQAHWRRLKPSGACPVGNVLQRNTSRCRTCTALTRVPCTGQERLCGCGRVLLYGVRCARATMTRHLNRLGQLSEFEQESKTE